MHDKKNNNSLSPDNSVAAPDQTERVMRHNSRIFSRMALIAGTVSVLLGCCTYISLIPASIAVALAAIVIRRKHTTGVTRVALACGVIGIILFLIQILFLILYMTLDDATLRALFERFGVDFDTFNRIYQSR